MPRPNLQNATHRAKFTRRAWLEIGAIGALGLGWPNLLRAREGEAASKDRIAGFGRAKRCVVIFQFGGPGQQDLWDMKPEAPAEARGEFRPVATTVPGMAICEHMPHLAQAARRFSIVRSMSHRDFEHGTASYTALTGQPHPNPGTNTPARPDDFPTYGSVVSQLRPSQRGVPDFVVLGPVMHQGNRPPLAGQGPGFLGRSYDPFRIAADPNEADFRVDVLAAHDDVPSPRLLARRKLVEDLNGLSRRIDEAALQVADQDRLAARAFELLRTSQGQQAFNLEQERDAVRDRYGRTKFGQTMLLARRLVEADVPLVTVNWSRMNADQWDTHKQNYPTLRKLLPPFDRGLAAFLTDLDERSLLDDTLVVCLGEFGRTPKMNKDAGRDHWPDCYSLLVAGGGLRNGQVIGESDRLAATPRTDGIAPWDLAATMFHLLGISPQGHLHDRFGRPLKISQGRVISELLA
ncbi:MAG: DUF1501 domain-containing protein [Pirellulaceae bacterium]